MNSYSTNKDMFDFHVENYSELVNDDGLKMIPNKVPELDANILEGGITCVLLDCFQIFSKLF